MLIAASTAEVQPVPRHRIDTPGCRCRFCKYALTCQSVNGFVAVASSRKRLLVPTNKDSDAVTWSTGAYRPRGGGMSRRTQSLFFLASSIVCRVSQGEGKHELLFAHWQLPDSIDKQVCHRAAFACISQKRGEGDLQSFCYFV